MVFEEEKMNKPFGHRIEKAWKNIDEPQSN